MQGLDDARVDGGGRLGFYGGCQQGDDLEPHRFGAAALLITHRSPTAGGLPGCGDRGVMAKFLELVVSSKVPAR
jgi:hypothetical protein